MKLLKVLITLFIFVLNFSCAHKSIDSIDWSKNIANIVLDAEVEFIGDEIFFDLDKGEVRKKDIEKYLYELSKEAKTEINVPKIYSKKEIKRVSLEIDKFLKRKGFKYANVEKHELLEFNMFSVGLVRKDINCLGYMLFYLSIGESLGLPMSGISMPGHVSIKWTNQINWDPTVARLCNDEAYVKWKGLSNRARKNDFYLRLLTKKEIAGIAYLNISNSLKEQERYIEMQKALSKALYFYPSPDALNAMGDELKRRGKNKEAVEYFDKAISLDENFSEAISNKIATLALMGKDIEQEMSKLEIIDKALAEELRRFLANKS